MLITKDLPPGQFLFFAVGTPLVLAAAIVGSRYSGFGALYSIGILMFFLFIPLSIAHFRRVRAATVSRTHRRIEIESPVAPDALYAKLAAAEFGRFRLRDRDAERRVLVLDAPVSGWSWGFDLPVFVRDAGGGSTIEIGIMPKMVQAEPTVELWHRKAADEIERILKA